MVEHRRGLGRGLSALLGDAEEAPAPVGEGPGPREIPIELLCRNEVQPRWTFADEDLNELAASIREKGVLQPILVRPLDAGKFEIVAGERRWRASQKAGLHSMPALVRLLDDAQVLEIAVIENVQRADLNPIEEAHAYRQLVDLHHRTQEQVADTVGKSRSHVANSLRLMNLPEPVRHYVLGGLLSAGHARAILSTDDPLAFADHVIAQHLSVRETEALVRRGSLTAPAKPAAGGSSARRPAKDTDTQALENDLSEVLGLAVEILDRGGVGELRIKYATLEQLDEVCRRLTRH